jgi:hypothetical protein
LPHRARCAMREITHAEDHVYIRAAAARAHEAAPQPAEREAEALGAQTSMSAEAETDLRNADVSQRKIVPLAQ